MIARNVQFSSLVAAGAVLGAYLVLAAILPPGGFYIGDQGVKYAQIEALARTGGLAVGAVGEPASVFRPEFGDPFYKQVGASYQVSYSPVYAVLVLPFYLVFGMVGLVMPSIIGTTVAAYASSRLGDLVGVRHPWAIVLVAGLASPLMFYGLVLWEQAFSVALLATAAYLALRQRAVSAGLLAGMAVWLRPEAYLMGPALVLAAFAAFGLRSGIRFTLRLMVGFLTSIVPWWVYNLLTASTPLGTHIAANTAIIEVSLASENRFTSLALQLAPVGHIKWLALLAVVLLLVVVLRLSKRSLLPALWAFWIGVVVIGVLHLLSGVAVASHSPIDVFPFVFASLAIPLALRKNDKRIRFLGILVAGYALGVIFVAPDTLTAGWGPRLLLGIYPILAGLAWLGFESTRHRLARMALLTLLVFSLAVQAASVLHLNQEGQRWSRLNAELAALEPKVVATAVWWLPQVGAPTFRDLRWYGVVDDRDLADVAMQTESFWWIRIDGYLEPGGHPMQATAPLPAERFSPVTTRQLSVRGLEATLYQVIR